MAEEERDRSQEPADEPQPQEAAPPGESPPAEGGAAEDASAEDASAEGASAEGASAEDASAQDAPAEDASAEGASAEQPQPASDQPQATEGEPPVRERPRRRRKQDQAQEEVIPGAHLEPDLVLEEEGREEPGAGDYAEAEAAYAVEEEEAAEPEAAPEEAEPEPVAREPLDLAADARYQATGKRKSAVARVVLKPGEGVYTINGRHLDQFFPRIKLQRMAMQPLEIAGYQARMDVVAKIHGGGVSSQAGALRHGIARALVEADPNLRIELKRRGFLTRDPRVKERKKAGLKKARKRPQFSKR
jgi:small subunit ribosomal protein S9